MYTAEVTQGAASTRLEWVADSDYRFFRPRRMRRSAMSCIRLTLP